MADGTLGQPSPAYDAFRVSCSADPTYTPASTPPIFVDNASRQVLALDSEADTFFGLLPGTNGTGPAMRRKCVPDDFTWISSDCRRARGVYSVPSDRSDELQTNPWSGR